MFDKPTAIIKQNNATPIYRIGSGNESSLTSYNWIVIFSAPHVREPYMATTIGAVNSTGVLTATIDGYNHVSVCPINIWNYLLRLH